MTQIEQVADRLAAYVNGFVENPESLIVDLSDFISVRRKILRQCFNY